MIFPHPIITQQSEITNYMHAILNVSAFKDYCPNGLQIEGENNITKIITGVTLNQALIDAAIDAQAQGILVHHGLFWKGDNPCIQGIAKKRIQKLLQHQINVWAYHLPLDAHPIYGNNACLAQLFEFDIHAYFGDQNLGCITNLALNTYINTQNKIIHSISVQDLHAKLTSIFKRKIYQFGTLTHEVAANLTHIAWCSGGAQSYFLDAIKAGCQVFISGEISEQYVHMAREYNVLYMVAGHHATERYGVQALGTHLAEKYGIEHTFVDIDTAF
jgi:dinuclear metal center YbgI/SA1388 family protein